MSDRSPVVVVALGGNALSPAKTGEQHYTVERANATRSGRTLDQLAGRGYRLVVVHGNGPQVGRLMQTDRDPQLHNLDIHVAQTQGELGYLLMSALEAPAACLVTRVVVGADAGPPLKPVGPILHARPGQGIAAVEVDGGWRRLVPSPRPTAVLEMDAIAAMLPTHHVIAGGGGGVPLTDDGSPVSAVVDKDWVASLLAVALDAEHLIFATDVDGVYQRFGEAGARRLDRLSMAEGRRLLQAGMLGAGSMAPKVESALEFAAATGREAHICALGDIERAIGASGVGTVIGQAANAAP
jgi:carbamate kinase